MDDSRFIVEVLHRLTPGESCIYFVGFLDGERFSNPGGESSRAADVAYGLMQSGHVILTQRRIGPPVSRGTSVDWKGGVGQGFEYIATGAYPRKPSSWRKL